MQPDGSRRTYSPGHDRNFAERWELKPGHQANVSARPIQFRGPDEELALTRSWSDVLPGMQTWTARISNRGEHWVRSPKDDGTSVKFVVPPGEWLGSLKAPPRRVELLRDKVPVQITSPRGLPADHELNHVLGPPQTINGSRTERIELRDGLTFYLNTERDQHWLADYARYTQTLYWGPIAGDQLSRLELLDQIAHRSRQLVLNAPDSSPAHRRVRLLVSSSQPLAELGLQLALLLDVPNPKESIPWDDVARMIRDRRVELQRMKLTSPMRAALEKLTVHDPALPDDSEFQVVSSQAVPQQVPDDAWGPANDGLCAAALMPEAIEEGKAVPVRLFLRNVGSKDIHLTVSDRPGYDYAAAADVHGAKLTTARPLVYPMGFASAIYPELNPGQNTSNPPLTTLTKILLRPGASMELKTKTALRLNRADEPLQQPFQLGHAEDSGQAGVTIINSKATEAFVTWHLHTANGAIHSKDLRRRLWPAKGGLDRTAAHGAGQSHLEGKRVIGIAERPGAAAHASFRS